MTFFLPRSIFFLPDCEAGVCLFGLGLTSVFVVAVEFFFPLVVFWDNNGADVASTVAHSNIVSLFILEISPDCGLDRKPFRCLNLRRQD